MADTKAAKQKRTVLCDMFRYGGVAHNGRTFYQTAHQGDEIEVTDDELARADLLAEEHGRPFLGTAADLDAARSVAPSPNAPMQVTDEVLDLYTAAQLTEYVNANPAEADRVHIREGMRDDPRQDVYDMLEARARVLAAAGG